MTLLDGSTRPRRGRQPRPPAERFWPKVDVRGPDDCWEWTAGTIAAGDVRYGCFRIRKGVSVTAHSYAKELATGVPCPPKQQAQHTCKTVISSLCCNPGHVVYAAPGHTAIRRATTGADNHLCKLTDDQVREIRARVAAGERPVDLAPAFGIHPSYVSNLASRIRRVHVS